MDNMYYRQIAKWHYLNFSSIISAIDQNHEIKKADFFSSFFRSNPPIEFFELFVGDDKKAQTIYQYAVITKGMIMGVVLQDLYLKLNRELALEIINDKNKKLFDRIIDAILKKDYALLLTDPKIVNEFINATLEFIESSAYYKVEAFKVLNFDDIKLLQSANSNFFKEYQKYSIEINQDWVLRQISKWIVGTKDEEMAFKETSQFLINAFAMDIDIKDILLEILNSGDDEPDTIMQALLDQDIDSIKNYVKNFYNRHKDKKKKLV